MTTRDLPEENVFGHTKKLRLILEAIEGHRRDADRIAIHVVDYGCGNGSAVTQFLCWSGYNIVGVDVHPDSIDYARKHFASPTCQFILGDWSDLARRKGEFDVVVFADVLEHVEQPGQLLSAALEALKAGGLVLISVPNGFGPFECESYISRIALLGPLTIKVADLVVAALNRYVFRGAWSRVVTSDDVPYNEESGHVQFFSRHRILALCREAGLEVRGFRHISFLSGPYSNYFFAPWRKFCQINSSIADRLPFWLVSAWFLELRKPEQSL
jgi:2-polyprenyl-3-methyl-5-hydroxy-6-metoxy-1,4-benzoquinol methylase